ITDDDRWIATTSCMRYLEAIDIHRRHLRANRQVGALDVDDEGAGIRPVTWNEARDPGEYSSVPVSSGGPGQEREQQECPCKPFGSPYQPSARPECAMPHPCRKRVH